MPHQAHEPWMAHEAILNGSWHEFLLHPVDKLTADRAFHMICSVADNHQCKIIQKSAKMQDVPMRKLFHTINDDFFKQLQTITNNFLLLVIDSVSSGAQTTIVFQTTVTTSSQLKQLIFVVLVV